MTLREQIEAASADEKSKSLSFNERVLASMRRSMLLSEAWDAGKLLVIEDEQGAVRRMVGALDRALAFDVESDVRAGELTHEERVKVATAAFAALKGEG